MSSPRISADAAILQVVEDIFDRNKVKYNPDDLWDAIANCTEEEFETLETAVEAEDEDVLADFFKDEITCPTDTEPRTLKELAQEAIDVQDACNPVAVANGFGRAITELFDNLGHDMTATRKHPIYSMWLSKIESMSSGDSLLEVMDKVESIAQS